MLVDLSKEGVQKWQQDAQADLDSAVVLFAGQIDKLQKMYQKLQKDYAKLYEDETVKHVLAGSEQRGQGHVPDRADAQRGSGREEAGA